MLAEHFDPQRDVLIREHCRPHWSQSGTVVFLTFRLHDSIPAEVLQRWEREKQDWVIRHGHSATEHWTTILPRLCKADQDAFRKQFERCREMFLDTCHGSCMLRDPELAGVVSDALLHFDGQRYRMGDFIIMPNHVHLLTAFSSEETLITQCDSWLHYTAVQINRRTGRKGKLWQQEPFDHLVRSPEQYDYLRKYIADNPVKAGLQPGEYLYRRDPE